MRKELEEAIEGTCPGLSPSELSMAKRVTTQMMEIAKFCLDGTYKLTKMLIDDKKGIVFPVFSNDNVETIVNRYLKLYPQEATLMVKSFQESIDGNESGWSKSKLMKRDFSMPVKIKNAGQAIAFDFWESNNCANMKKFKAYCPKLVTKSRNI